MANFQIVTVAGENALAELTRLRAEFAATGLYPILLGDDSDYDHIAENLIDAEDTLAFQTTLDVSSKIDPVAWLKAKRESDPELYSAGEGDWKPSKHMGIITHQNMLTGEPKDEVLIGMFNVKQSWEVFAHLNWGGFNDCPIPAEHCALHRYWAEKYGAEVVSVTGAIVQCMVARPPTDRKSSFALAQEHYVYCYDIVDQGTETIGALASSLVNSEYWYFWWD